MGNNNTIPFNYNIKEYNDNGSFKTPLVVIFESDINHPNVQKLVYTLEKNGFEYSVIGNGTRWQHNGTKIVGYHEYYKTLNPERIVIQLDSRDVLVCQDYEYFNKLLKYYTEILDTKLIISAEFGLSPVTSKFPPGSFVNNQLVRTKRTDDYSMEYHHAYKWISKFNKKSTDHDNRINSGMIIGRVKNFINLYQIMDMTPSEKSDQTVMSDIYFKRPELFYIDTKLVFFTNVFAHTLICNVNKGKYITQLGTKPVFIQMPDKNWGCYNKLFNELKK